MIKLVGLTCALRVMIKLVGLTCALRVMIKLVGLTCALRVMIKLVGLTCALRVSDLGHARAGRAQSIHGAEQRCTCALAMCGGLCGGSGRPRGVRQAPAQTPQVPAACLPRRQAQPRAGGAGHGPRGQPLRHVGGAAAEAGGGVGRGR